jgi:thiol peroxidase
MPQVHFKGKPLHTAGKLPELKTVAPNFTLVDKSLKNMSLDDFKGKKKILATVPSLDTDTCSTMTKRLNEIAKKHPDIVILTVSADLPFAQKRFCEHENVENVITLSMMRDKEFGRAYGVLLEDGAVAGLLARSLFVLDETGHILHIDLVSEITQEPDYEAALAKLS